MRINTLRCMRTVTAVTVFLVTLAAMPLRAHAEDITIAPRLRAGDSFRLELVRTREDSARPERNSTSRTLVDVRVVAVTATGTTLDWTPGDTVIEGIQAIQDPALAAASKAVSGLTYRLLLNSDGALTGLGNRAEVEPKLQASMSAVVKSLAASLPAKDQKPFSDMMTQLMSTQALVSIAVREAEIFFGLNAAVLGPGETAEADLEVPSPLGGGVIEAKFIVEMTAATAETASLKTAMVYDPATLLRATQAIAAQAGRPIPPEELAKLSLKLNDDGKYVYDRALGLMREATVDRRIASGDQRRLDSWRIRLITAPKRP